MVIVYRICLLPPTSQLRQSDSNPVGLALDNVAPDPYLVSMTIKALVSYANHEALLDSTWWYHATRWKGAWIMDMDYEDVISVSPLDI